VCAFPWADDWIESPILALFGEQMAKQYMSQSMGWVDDVIFAMAPLRVITHR